MDYEALKSQSLANCTAVTPCLVLYTKLCVLKLWANIPESIFTIYLSSGTYDREKSAHPV